MATILLERRGSSLRYKTPKLQVSVPAPSQSIIYDQCGVPIGKKVAGSFQISGRIDCFNPVTEIMRVSYRYFFSNNPLDLVDLSTALLGAGAAGPPDSPSGIFVPAPPGFLRTREFFLGNPRLPVEQSIDGANYPLIDACKVTIGTVEDKNLQQYGYTTACSAISRFGYSTTLARHSSITDGSALSNIDVLSGYALFQQTTEAVPISNQDDMLTAWVALAGANVDIEVGAFEPTP